MYWNQDRSWLIGYRDWFAPENYWVRFPSSTLLFFYTFYFFIFFIYYLFLLFFIHYYFSLFHLEPKTTSRRAGLSASAELLVSIGAYANLYSLKNLSSSITHYRLGLGKGKSLGFMSGLTLPQGDTANRLGITPNVADEVIFMLEMAVNNVTDGLIRRCRK